MFENNWTSAATTDIGTVREVNEDNFLDAPQVGMWCVADGMGGHEKGDVASRMIIEYLDCLTTPELFPLTPEQISERLLSVNDRLVEMAQDLPRSSVIGSTVAVLVFDEQNAHCIWAGDSRIYRLRGNEFTQLTKDHSQVEEMVESGLITAEEAESHPAANVITRAVGANEILELDVISHPLQKDDIFLLCSDGLNKVMNDSDIADLLRICPLDTTPDTLIKTALDRQARDNVTVVTVRHHGAAEASPIESGHLQGTLPLDDTLPLKL